jgi:hypothetical protein
VLPLSHLGTTGRDQWDRVLRWHHRLARIRAVLPRSGPEKRYALDDIFAFFMNCYHLADWIAQDGEKPRHEVEAFIDQSEPMRLCRDVCNGLKHYRLDPGRRSENPNWTTTTVITFEAGAEPPAPSEITAGWVILTEGRTIDMFELADACVAEWRRFLDPQPAGSARQTPG